MNTRASINALGRCRSVLSRLHASNPNAACAALISLDSSWLSRSLCRQQSALKRNRLRYALAICLMQFLGLTFFLSGAKAVAQTGTLIAFETPRQGYAAVNGQFTVTIDLKSGAQPSTLSVTSGYTDVTSLFNVGGCAQAPCTLSATLTTANGIVAGQNFITASVLGTGGAAQSAHMQFNGSGVSDPTNGSAPGYIVPIQQTITATSSTITIGTPTPIVVQPCTGADNIRIAVLNRSTLALKTTNCYGAAQVAPFLSGLDQSDLVFVLSAPGNTTGAADFTAIGGSKSPTGGFAQYSAIGYGKASAGMAHEAWYDAHQAGSSYATVRGTLVNMGCQSLYGTDSKGNTVPPTTVQACSINQSASLYSFLATDNIGFAIVPGAAGSAGSPGLPTIYVGNPSNIPVGDSTVPTNQIRPLNSNTNGDLFTYATYSPTWSGGSAAGGVYLLVLNSIDMTPISQTLYVTNCGCTDHTNDNNQVSALAAALTTTTSNSATATATQHPNQIYLFTTVGIPFNTGANYASLIGAVSALGISPYALQAVIPDNLGTAAGTGFSFVSYALEPTAPGIATGAPAPASVDATSSNPVKLWSSSANAQQGETGALHGVFVKGNNAYYVPNNVGPFDVSDLPVYATGDDFLSNASTYALGSTEPVAWPFMDTPGGRAAYSYLSTQIINYNLFTGGNPNSINQCSYECDDIRFWYTGDQAANLYTPLAAGAVQYPGDSTAAAKGFTKTDFDNVQQQLDLEQVYLKEVLALKSFAEQENTNASQNIALALTQAGTNIALDMQNQLGFSQKEVGDTPIRIAGDAFNLGAGVGAFIIPALPKAKIGEFLKDVGFPFTDGILWTISAALTVTADAKTNTTNTQPDPYVTQLQELISSESNAATTAATNFNANLESATGIFYNGVFSDWFRLQSVALMSVNQGYGGWYVADTDQDTLLGEKISYLTAGQRVQLWQQIIPQYFTKAQYDGIASGGLINQFAPYIQDVGDVAKYFSEFYPRELGGCGNSCPDVDLDPAATVQAGWTMRTSPSLPSVCQDLTYVFQGNSFGKFWTSSIGSTLLGVPASSTGLSNLNIDPNWLLDEWGIPWQAKTPEGSSWNFPRKVLSTTEYDNELNQSVSWDCGTYSWPFDQATVSFSGLTVSPSATITQGTIATVTISGKMSAHGATNTGAGSIPSGSVTITLNDITQTAKISSSDGSFQSAFAAQSIPGSPTPYVISISYPGTALYAPASDLSQTLTVLSPDTDVQLIADLNPSSFGQTVTLTATVKSPAGTPTGSVGFYDSAASLGVASLDANGRAQLPLSQLSAGTHLITASYAGANGIAGNTSDLIYLEVNRLSTALVVTGPSPYAVFGAATVHLTGQLAGKNGSTIVSYPPAGESVTVIINNVSQTATLGASGSFALDFPLSSFVGGTYPIQIVYQGDNDFTPLTDQSTSLLVAPGTTKFGALTPSQTIQAGTQSIVLSGRVASINGVTATGTVFAYINGANSVTVPLTDGAFTLSYNTTTLLPSATAYQIVYQYSGDSNYAPIGDGSTSLTVLQSAIPTFFQNLTPSQAINYGHPTVTLSGKISTTPQSGGVLTQGSKAGANINFTNPDDEASRADTTHATFSAWINTTQKSQQMILQAATNVDEGEMLVYVQNDQIGVNWTNGYVSSDNWLSTDTKPVSDGQWHHIAIVFGSSASGGLWYATLYKDGVSTGESFGEHEYAFETNPIDLAAAADDGSIPAFTGEMWNAKLWNKALSASDLAADMYQFYQAPTPIGLLLESSFDPASQRANNVASTEGDTPVDGLIVTDQLPVEAPPAGEQIAINVGANTQQATIGLLGSFSLDFATAGIAPGNYSIQYRYSGDNRFSATSDGSTTLVIQPTTTTTSLTSSAASAASILYGTPVTFTATVSADNVTPTGTVTFYDGSTSIGPVELLAAGTASFSTSSLAVGSHSIMAVYPGAANFASSSSTIVPVTITPLTPTFTNLTSSTISYGTSSITLGGNISAGGSIPSGSVLITISGSSTVQASAPIKLDGTFSAALNTNKLAMGTYQVTYTYAASGNFGDATNNSTQLIVGLASATNSLTTSSPRAAYGTTVTFTATVSSSIGSPSGTVIFMDGATALGTPVTLSGGAASLPTSTLSAGLHSITAIYSGDSTFATSTSNVLSQYIVALTPVFSILTPSQSIPVGTASVTLSGQIAAGSFIPSGTVSITVNGSTTPATIRSDGTFSATVDTHALSIDSYAVTYSFAAGGNFKAATDSNTRITVAANNTLTALDSSATTSDYGTFVTFTATVSNPSTATGSVAFFDSGNLLGTPVTVVAGKAVWQTGSLSVGSHQMTAVYTSDSPAYIGSTSAILTETIQALTSVFSNLTPSQTVNSGDSSVNLKGTISSTPLTGNILQYLTSTTDSGGGVALPYDTTGVSTDGATYSMWINTTSKANQMLFQISNTRPVIAMTGDQLIVWLGYPDQTVKWTSDDTRPISDGQWHHIAATFNQGIIKLYKDGIATDDAFAVPTSEGVYSPANLGGSFSGISGFLGQMWNAKIWAGALSAADIAADMSQTYTNAIPNNLRLLASFDASANTATNLVNGQSVAVDSATLGSIASATLPAYYPAASEPITITIGSQSQTVNTGEDGSFATTFPLNGFTADNYPIQYSYKGNAYLASSTDESTKLSVDNLSTTTVVNSSALTADYNTPLVFTATVSSQNAIPTGTVLFEDGGVPMGDGQPVTLSPKGTASFPISTLTVGLHSITAIYTSNNTSAFSNSTSTAIIQTINKLTPVFSGLTKSQSVNQGSSITLGGKIAAGSAMLSGSSVSITLNGNSKSATIGGDGSFSQTFTISNMVSQDYAVTYAFQANDNFNGVTDSTTTTITVVGLIQPAVTMWATPNPVQQGAALTLYATVQPTGGHIPTGTVQFSEYTYDVNGQPVPHYYGVANVDATGTATLVTPAPSYEDPTTTAGTHILAATYGGDGNQYYAAATSPSYTLTVNSVVGSAPGFSLTVASGGSTTATVAKGVSANFPLSLASVSGYTGSVALTCAPADLVSTMGCSISPALVTLTSAPQTATVTVTTEGATANVVQKMAFLIGALALIPLAYRRRRGIASLFLFIAVAMFASAGCGGGSSSPKQQYASPGTYYFTITASSTSGTSITSSIKLSVVVQ